MVWQAAESEAGITSVAPKFSTAGILLPARGGMRGGFRRNRVVGGACSRAEGDSYKLQTVGPALYCIGEAGTRL